MCGSDEIMAVKCSGNGKFVFRWLISLLCVCMCVPECLFTCVCGVYHLCPAISMAVTSALALSLQALPGPHYYTWGDHGGIIMAIAQGMETNELK